MSMPITSEMITYPANNHHTPAFLARPQTAGPYPGVVVIQEWWGLLPHIKEVATRFARAGFVALAPDLYYGAAATEPDEARKLAMALDRERAVRDIDAAARYLGGLENVSPAKVGVVGWCMGGALALSTAASSDRIGATVAFYGRPLSEEDTARIQAPVLGLYGEADTGIPVTAVKEFEQALATHGVPHEIHIYPGARHAFFNDTRLQAYDPQAAADAWTRTLAWFRRYLVAPE